MDDYRCQGADVAEAQYGRTRANPSRLGGGALASGAKSPPQTPTLGDVHRRILQLASGVNSLNERTAADVAGLRTIADAVYGPLPKEDTNQAFDRQFALAPCPSADGVTAGLFGALEELSDSLERAEQRRRDMAEEICRLGNLA